MRLGWIFDSRLLLHDTGRFHPERPERLEAIREAVRQSGLQASLEALPIRAATAEQLAWVHEPAYVALVRMACDGGFEFIGGQDTRICRRSYDAAALAAGAALSACEAVVSGHVRRAFCAIRPPGHHAEADLATGFCLFNNAALAAECLVRNHRLRRIAIVDFDVHHGNGTQKLFETRADVFYISLHERPASLPFPGSGDVSEIGREAGRGYTLNVPLNPGSGWPEYRSALEIHVVPALQDYRPEVLLLSAGFDALASERLAHIRLEPPAFGWITRMLVDAAEAHSGGRVVSLLEGGYDLEGLGPAVVAHLRALLDAD